MLLILLPWVPILCRVNTSSGNIEETTTNENATELNCYSSPGHNFTVTVEAVNTAGVSPPTIIIVTVNPSTIPFTCKYQCLYDAIPDLSMNMLGIIVYNFRGVKIKVLLMLPAIFNHKH